MDKKLLDPIESLGVILITINVTVILALKLVATASTIGSFIISIILTNISSLCVLIILGLILGAGQNDN